ncbi:MAG: queuosine precursor transporter [Cytophagales bacterium]|nr:queuosine precursor transporter [Bernardetiaceae bacterium]MDW8204947.1 queuosine precursor transporter [Cytophagales bacterium]
MTQLQQKKNNLFFILSGLFLTNALVAEMVGTKIFSLEKTLNFPPAQIPLLGDFVLDFNLTAGVVLWPIVFITSDIINEYFGKAGVRKISLLTAMFISYAFVMIYAATQLVPADFWLNINSTDSAGNPLNINEAFNRIFLQSLGIIIGSLTAFLVGQLLDAVTFQWIRRLTGSRIIWLRATGSTLVSQLIDSFIVLGIAFYVFGNPRWTFEQVISVGIINYIYKFVIAIVMIPMLYVMHFAIKAYLGDKASEEMANEAAKTELF